MKLQIPRPAPPAPPAEQNASPTWREWSISPRMTAALRTQHHRNTSSSHYTTSATGKPGCVWVAVRFDHRQERITDGRWVYPVWVCLARSGWPREAWRKRRYISSRFIAGHKGRNYLRDEGSPADLMLGRNTWLRIMAARSTGARWGGAEPCSAGVWLASTWPLV